MKIKTILLALFIVFLFSPSLLFAQTNEQITITTYYPSPNGVYNQLAANKFVVDIANMGEYGSMQNGDAHIGGSLIIGASGNGYAYGSATINPGDVLIEGIEGIGTSDPERSNGVRLHVAQGHIQLDEDFGIGDAVAVYGLIPHATDGNLYLITNGGYRVTVDSNGNTGIGGDDAPLLPQNKLDVKGNAVIGNTYSGTATAEPDGLLVEGVVGIGTDTPLTNNATKLHVAGGHIRLDTDFGIGDPDEIYGLIPHDSTDSLQLVTNNRNGITISSIQNVGVIDTTPDTSPGYAQPQGATQGYITASDVWLRDANPPKWASENSIQTQIVVSAVASGYNDSPSCCSTIGPDWVMTGCSICRTNAAGRCKDTGDEENIGIIGAWPGNTIDAVDTIVPNDNCCHGTCDGSRHKTFAICAKGTNL